MAKRYTVVLNLIIITFISVGFSSILQAGQTASVEVNKVKTQFLSENIKFTARLVAVQSGYVSARIAGPVIDVRIELGDYVEKGEIIAKTDTALLVGENNRLKALVDESIRQVARFQSEANLKLAELNRLEKLQNSVVFQKSQYEDSRQKLIIAKKLIEIAIAKKSIAEANLAINEVNLEWSTVRAPYNGIITAIHTEIGSWLQKGQNVITMLNNRDLEILADLPAKYISGIEQGMPIAFISTNEEKFQAIVRKILPEEDILSHTRQVRFTPDSKFLKNSIAPGQSVTIIIPVGSKKDSITVHKDALVNVAGQTFVFVAIEGKAQIRPITIGSSIGNRFEVINGLQDGEQVVIRGNERLQPGQSIKISTKTEE
ncbi:MAG: hypothetical protein CMM30_08900 [Rhodospirillaceae bacterium]|nr:hypothetical protein [Rhodospirillaceae bacterium]